MKIVDAFWEKRNLNCESLEIDLVNESELDKLKQILDKITSHTYVVIRVPTGIDFPVELTAKYQIDLVEIIHKVELYMPNIALNPIRARILAETVFKTSTNEELSLFCSNLQVGLIPDDRISLDPKFGRNVSGIRYSNWLRDLHDQSCVFSIFVKNKLVGFFTLKASNNGVKSELGSILDCQNTRGLGFLTSVGASKFAFENWNREVEIGFSSNNVMVGKVIESLGYKPQNSSKVYTCHIGN